MSITRTGTCYIYVIAEHGAERPVKIGVAQDPLKRLSSMQSGNHRKLTLRHQVLCDNKDHGVAVEAALHAWFAARRGLGEWFDVHWKMAAIVANKMAEIPGGEVEARIAHGQLPEIDLGYDFSPDAA